MNDIDNEQLLEAVRKTVWKQTGTALHFQNPFEEKDAICCGIAAAYETLCPYHGYSWSIDDIHQAYTENPEIQVIASNEDSISLQGANCRWDILIKRIQKRRAFDASQSYTVSVNGQEAFKRYSLDLSAIIRINSLFNEIADASKDSRMKQMSRRIEKEIIKTTRLAKKNTDKQ